MTDTRSTETRFIFTESELKAYFTAVFQYGVFQHMNDPKRWESGYTIYQTKSLCKKQWETVLRLEDAARQTLTEVDEWPL